MAKMRLRWMAWERIRDLRLSRQKDGFDVIPMWVADMNFETVPTIPKAIMDRAAHPAYGYFSPVKSI